WFSRSVESPPGAGTKYGDFGFAHLERSTDGSTTGTLENGSVDLECGIRAGVGGSHGGVLTASWKHVCSVDFFVGIDATTFWEPRRIEKSPYGHRIESRFATWAGPG